MPITRRDALSLLASGPIAAAQEQSAQSSLPADSIALHWLGGAPPPFPAGVTWGVPFARGAVSRTQSFTLTTGGKPLPLQTWPLAYWPDGSLKFAAFATVAGPDSGTALRLARGSAPPPAPALQLRETAEAIEIDTGRVQCRVPKRGGAFLESVSMEGREIAREGRLVCSLEDDFAGVTRTLTVEQRGPVRAVVKIEGVHKAVQGTREWLPFVLRLYFYAGSEQIRLAHTIVFDGDHEKDLIRAMGLAFSVPLREQVHNRHVRFSGENGGLWSEPLQPLAGRGFLSVPGAGRGGAYAEQLAGKRLPNREAYDARGRKVLADLAVWDSYKLVQPNASGFTIVKRTNAQSCWLDAAAGRRASGLVFAGDVSGGLAAGVRNFWQSYPASLEVRQAAGDAADLRVWLWSPDAPPMDLRHYDTRGHDLDTSYEDWQPGFSTPHGVARTSEVTLFPSAGVPPREEAALQAQLAGDPPLLCASPRQIHSAGVFGIWSLPERSTPEKSSIEDRLDAAFAFYRKEVDQRNWYGYWNYGDIMHQYDGARHAWRYDIGGFAWDNTELGSVMWLWYQFLRTGRADAFRMAEAMTRHTSEVDVYHLGRFNKLGSRHNVRHWGCGAKELRISQAPYHRFYYYLTADERVGDLMRAVADADYTLPDLDPMRLASPRTGPIPYPARIRGGPDWLACVGNWMTEWERTGDPKWCDKIVVGMDSIAAMPYGFLTGPNQLYGYDPKTGKLYPLVPDGYGTYNLTTIMGGGEVVFELNELIEHPGWRKAWLQYCRLQSAPKAVAARDNITGTEGADARYAGSGRLAAYVYRETKSPDFAKRAWGSIRIPAFTGTHTDGSAVLNPIDEIPNVSTNSTAQGCLEAIEILAMCP
ncbi:MAG: hypothetical protein LAQ30_20265 [Acidobacteriia bacterium]|nr:hypothetical protein [Terriglobia bacterium]